LQTSTYSNSLFERVVSINATRCQLVIRISVVMPYDIHRTNWHAVTGLKISRIYSNQPTTISFLFEILEHRWWQEEPALLVRVCVYVYVYVCMCVCVCMCVWMCVFVCVLGAGDLPLHLRWAFISHEWIHINQLESKYFFVWGNNSD